MSLKPKYTPNDIIKSLDRPKTIFEIQTTLGSSRRTVWNMMMMLLEVGKVKRLNRSNPNKPVYEYYLADGVKPTMEPQAKKTLKSLGREL